MTKEAYTSHSFKLHEGIAIKPKHFSSTLRVLF